MFLLPHAMEMNQVIYFAISSMQNVIFSNFFEIHFAFMPHGMCYLWKPELMGLHLVADGLIALAYYSIPGMLVYFAIKRQDIPFPWIFLLFSAFIIACGTTHIMSVWTVWHPDYWISGIVKALTAAVSLSTALSLVPLIPAALALPSPATLESANRALQIEINERKQAEAEKLTLITSLQQSEARYRAIVQDQTELICRFLPNHTLTFVNSAYCHYFGKSADELIGKTFFSGIFPEDVALVEQQLKILSQENPVIILTHRVILPHGEVRLHEWINRAIFDQHGDVIEFQAVGRDITEQTKLIASLQAAEAAKQESEERFKNAFEYAAIGVALLSLTGRWLQVNGALCRILGYSEYELLGTTTQSLFHPDDVDLDSNSMGQLLMGEIRTYQTEKRMIHKLGYPVWLRWNVSVVRDRSSQPLYLITQIQDITTERQAAESLKAYAAQLEASNRELQDFAYVASHDLQEPLRKIRTFGDRLKVKCASALDAQGQDYLERMQNAAQRMQVLIENLLALSRVAMQTRPFVAVNLGELVTEVLSDLEVHIEQKAAKIEVAELPTLEADPTQMRQLLQNLVDNALKFHRSLVTPTVKIYSERLNEPLSRELERSSQIGIYQITVEDNGIGFDEKYLDKIFTPFQRLHSRSQYEGTGIGLALCRKIVERHGGTITASSQLGEGSKFIIKLPVKYR